MAESIAEQVQRYLTEHPDCSNQELYEAFPKARPNTLRHYKSKFAHPAKEESPSPSKPKASAPVTLGPSLEERLDRLEEQMQKILEHLDLEPKKSPLKDYLSHKTEGLDKVLKEMEDGVFNLIKETKAKIQQSKKPDLSLDDLEELRQKIFHRVGSFISNLKNKNDQDRDD